MGKERIGFTNNHDCARCRNGEIVEIAVVFVSHPRSDYLSLRTKEWVCDEHSCMLQDDYGSQLRVERSPKPFVPGWPNKQTKRPRTYCPPEDSKEPEGRGYPTFPPTGHLFHCQRCGRTLEPDQIVWLELDQRTDTYVDPAIVRVPDEQSQGCFPFGADCAALLKAEEA